MYTALFRNISPKITDFNKFTYQIFFLSFYKKKEKEKEIKKV